MSPGPTFDRVYLALKAQLTGGQHAPGAHLEPSLLGEALSASITPVRDALHRLVGERLVEAPRHNGFRVPAPTEAELRDLYGWRGALLTLALRADGRRGAATGWRPEPAPDAPLAGAPDLFRAIARRSGSQEQEAALINLNERLAALLRAEQRVFGDSREECAPLLAAWRADQLAPLRRFIAAYHRRRQRAAPGILLASRTLARRA